MKPSYQRTALFLARSIAGLLICGPALALHAGLSPDGRIKDELRMVVDYADGKQKSRISHDGDMEAVGLLPNQTITITLNFAREHAGAPVAIALLDGGALGAQPTTTLPANGKLTFTFGAAAAPGLYRVVVTSLEKYQLNLYVARPTASSTQ